LMEVAELAEFVAVRHGVLLGESVDR